jgi:pyruvate dehydrogenase E2 component (dihydrolipoamide acetyltransferase)
MSIRILVPKAGMGTTEGTIARWLKKQGDRVDEGEVIVEIECAKAIEEVPSPIAGVLRAILVAEGETVPVYTEIAVVEEASPDSNA